MAIGWELIYIGGISISLFLFIILISKQHKSTADRILCAWFFFAVIHLLFIAGYASGVIYKVPMLLGWELPLPFLHGPFLYLYILFLSGQQRNERRYIIHFIPAVSVAGLLIFILPSVQFNTLSTQPFFKTLFKGMVAAIMISGVAYVAGSLILLHKHRRNIVGQFSNTDKITLNWMRYLIFGMGLIWVVVIFIQPVQVLYIAVGLFIFFIGYFGIRQVGIFSNVSSAHEVIRPIVLESDVLPAAESVSEAADHIKYEKTKLEDSKAIEIQERLTLLMKEKECYKDSELTLGDLAKMLDIQPGMLSQVINSKEGKNFYDYINTLRAEAFKRLLLQPESKQYTLLSLAFECGFNSKTSFNRNFKKMTGMSPSQYAKQLKIEIQTGDEK
ncbi:AraC family transcriptional regulator [Chryseobacterium arthrosphaerae]|uniref:AraC family transcriptional regulator n=1 Tax=Chryseobacterium arthrosphaerae TaxID=651561 RepID=UPI000F5131FF|nr:helix-turn-helix domain-containing protein [Chryseobacterium arthrosphaerae]AYZ11505.1 AraC family transcriptional regulator [Chryseobacterium arthrosphaerae]MDG4652991.1 helix-turn-helix domain-containing protein [Chryseobacterium arthrosphaerae]